MVLGTLAQGAIIASAEEGILRILLNRPDKKNAVNAQMYDAMADLLRTAKDSAAIRAVLITAEGQDFCAGNDISELHAGSAGVGFAERPVGRFAYQLAWFDKPFVAAVRGRAIGLGFTLLLHCDLLFVAKDAVLSAPFARLGLCPEAGSSVLLPRLAGHRRALEIFARNRTLTGVEAVQWGIAHQAGDADQVEALALDEAKRLVAQPMAALRAIKRLVRPAEDIWDAMNREVRELELLRGDPATISALARARGKPAVEHSEGPGHRGQAAQT